MNVDDNNNEQVDKENKRERDVSEIDWSGLGDVVMKRYFARLKKDGLLPSYLEKYLVEEDKKSDRKEPVTHKA